MGMLERMCGAGERMGRRHSSIWGVELSDKKKIKMKYTTALDSSQ